MENRKSNVPQPINEPLAASTPAKTTKQTQSRAASNRQNGLKSTGPKTEQGKAKVSANALKTGYFASVERLHPHDSPAYIGAVEDLRLGLHPDGPVEEMLIRELAMFRARLMRLEAAEYALLCSGMETNTGDAREIAVALLNNSEALDRLHKAEVHLRRSYNRTWDRLERMQKERHKLPLNEALKQSQVWLTAEAKRTNRPELIPQRHPAIDEKGDFIKRDKGDPMYRPEKDEE